MAPSPAEQALLQILPLLVIVILLPSWVWSAARVLRKAGHPGWWALLSLVPILNIALLWLFAFSDWPALKARR